MPENPAVIISGDYSRFKIATDPELMKIRFQDSLGRIGMDKPLFDQFWVTRVIPRDNNQFAIQYESLWRKKRTLFFGLLLGSEEAIPDYVRSDNREVIYYDDLKLAAPIYPFDPKLKQLQSLCGPKAVGILEAIRPLLGFDKFDMKIVDIETLGYRVEKRAVLRYNLEFTPRHRPRSEKFPLIAKIMSGRNLSKFESSTRRLLNNGFDKLTDGYHTVPDIYYIDNNINVVFMENVPGKSLHFLHDSAIFRRACIAAANILRKLHSINAEGLKSYTIADELGGLQSKVDLAAGMFPELAADYAATFDRLNRASSSINDKENTVTVHRDFYDKQVIYSENRVTLLDFDNLACGDAAIDCGNFLAHLTLRVLQSPENTKNLNLGKAEFCQAYPIAESELKKRVYWWQAATLLRLSVLYLLRPRWRTVAPTLLRDALELLK